jgi:4'-phosphopantetheinyl transferase
MSEIIAVQVPHELKSAEYDFLMSNVTAAKQKRIKRFLHREDAYRSLIGDILIRVMACKYLHTSNDCLMFEENAYGKPSLAGDGDFHYNLSHSGRWAAAIFGKSPVGIDVEEIKPIDDQIAERFFSLQECKSLLSKAAIDRLDYFYDLWTLKESFIKAVGHGLSIPLHSFSIYFLSDNSISVESGIKSPYFFKQYSLEKKYKLSACSSLDNLPPAFIQITFEELYELAFKLFIFKR